MSERILIPCQPALGRARLTFRWTRFAIECLRRGWYDYSINAVQAIVMLAIQTLRDVARPRDVVECNYCGWHGRRFYPNTGPGYHESATTCPGCLAQDRHRSMLDVLESEQVRMFDHHGVRVVEVAPMRSLEARCLRDSSIDYVNFDLHRHAMQRGDIRRMRFRDGSIDVFLCFHVLEHIAEEDDALTEIYRVLRPGGVAVLQVPIDFAALVTVEWGAPDPREVGHVRQYGRDFPERVAAHGFNVEAVNVANTRSEAYVERHGLSTEPIYLAWRPSP